MNPYETSSTLQHDAQIAIKPCMRCGSTNLIRTDPRFTQSGVLGWFHFGWIFFVFRYSFLMPADTCQDCGARVHFKPFGSLLMMFGLLFLPYAAVLVVGHLLN